jgi:hypothetical protein
VSAQITKDAANEWIAHANLPEDLTGHTIRLVTFTSEEDCDIFIRGARSPPDDFGSGSVRFPS